MEKVFLIDGHAQIFRMYYAFLSHPLINSKGVNTSILFGFTKMLLELIAKEHPTHLAVSFDAKEKTFRHEMFSDYKANRPPAPELVIEALEPLKEILSALNIPTAVICGVEADDVIGSMATQWSSDERQVYMVTPDKDYGQIVSKNIFQYKLPKGGNGETEILGEKEICDHYGISEPGGVTDILAIWGDASDNIPGVRGIGEVGAKKLIGRYGSVENMLGHISELPAKQAEKINASIESLKMSKFLVTIKTDVDLPFKAEDIEVALPDEAAVDAVFGKYEIKSLKKLITAFGGKAGSVQLPGDCEEDDGDFPAGSDFGDSPDGTEADENGGTDTAFVAGVPVVRAIDAEELSRLARLKREVFIESVSDKALIIGVMEEDSTPAAPKSAVYVCRNIIGQAAGVRTGMLAGVMSDAMSDAIRDILSDNAVSKTGREMKALCKRLLGTDVRLGGDLYDLQLMHYLADPEVSHTISFIMQENLGIDTDTLTKSVADDEPADLFSQSDEDAETEAAIAATQETASLYIYLRNRLSDRLGETLSGLYRNVEMPLVTTLAEMERAGVRIDTAQLAGQSRTLTAQMIGIEKNARELAGDGNLNLSSPKQIGALLFEKLKVDPNVKKSAKGNYSTDEATLRALEHTHPVIKEILEYRNLKKLLSTYIDALPLLIDKSEGKVHTTFNQALTATGRLSSINPNLQNIPIRTERGREIRKAFVPSDPAGCIVSSDYSQIELRLMAHMSGDKHLIEAFMSGQDIHAATAARLFGVDIANVTDEERRRAKTVNFGIIYGISAFGLAERMGIGVREAEEFIDAYFRTYPGVSAYISESIEKARRLGYVETIYGRRRYLREINSRNSNVRKFNERNAVNAPLQGSAADIIKIAMVNVAARIKKENLASRMVLQVHDELVFDVAAGEREAVLAVAKEEMENVASLKVKLLAECGYGENWLEAH